MMEPGQAVIALQDIMIGATRIPAGTVGIVEYAYPTWACVQFEGHLRQSNIPLSWLRPVRLGVADQVEVRA